MTKDEIQELREQLQENASRWNAILDEMEQRLGWKFESPRPRPLLVPDPDDEDAS